MMMRVSIFSILIIYFLTVCGCKNADDSYILSGIKFTYLNKEYSSKGSFDYIIYNLNYESIGLAVQIESEEFGLVDIVFDVPDVPKIERNEEYYNKLIGKYSTRKQNVWCTLRPNNEYIYSDSCNLYIDYFSIERLTGTFVLYNKDKIIISGDYDIPVAL